MFSAVAALEQRITALEARLNALETLDASDVPGTYRFALLGIEWRQDTIVRLSLLSRQRAYTAAMLHSDSPRSGPSARRDV